MRSSAIDIARLRLWLSLIVDEDDYATIDALPNLDYKIMQGNSLIEEYEGVKGVLKHFKYSLSGGRELGELWADVETAIAKTTGKSFQSTQKRSEVKAAIKIFNEAFGELFKPGSPENILKHARPILDKFKHHIEIDLRFPQARPTDDLSSIEGAIVEVSLRFAGKSVNKPS